MTTIPQRSGTRLIAQLAERSASHPRMEAAVMGAVRAELPGIIEDVMREMFAGENVSLWVPKIGQQARRERDARISAALSSGQRCSDIAARERVSKRHVERVKARHMRQVTP